MAVVSILERPAYGVSEAAAMLGLRTDRVQAWLDGYERGGRSYEPVIRAEPTGDDIVTWGEFVELGYLREYRRKEVPLQRLRPVIAALRESTKHSLAILAKHWTEINRHVDEDGEGPWMFTVTNDGLRKIEL